MQRDPVSWYSQPHQYPSNCQHNEQIDNSSQVQNLVARFEALATQPSDNRSAAQLSQVLVPAPAEMAIGLPPGVVYPQGYSPRQPSNTFLRTPSTRSSPLFIRPLHLFILRLLMVHHQPFPIPLCNIIHTVPLPFSLLPTPLHLPTTSLFRR